MPRYHTLGSIPHKRHTTFKKPDGSLYYEQLFGTIGFDGMSSLMYHVHRPTQVKDIIKTQDISPKAAVEYHVKSRLLKGLELPSEDDFLISRKVILFNSDVHVALAAPRKSMTDYFYKNADADELLFIHKGSGTLKTFLGEITFGYGDYILIPRGIIYQIHFDTEDNRILIT
ncbi:homogentisate 1,2-dioxygenase, partial [Zobellia laminariae]|uniref:homogentisate 1,2-dioxygenase n=1 Tax=Zobellia laminariae TaxID=248906 RepID=UPI0040574DC5